MAVKRLRGKLDYAPIGFQLLPAEFTLRELQECTRPSSARPLNKDSFRRRMLASRAARGDRRERREDVEHRPPSSTASHARSAI